MGPISSSSVPWANITPVHSLVKMDAFQLVNLSDLVFLRNYKRPSFFCSIVSASWIAALIKRDLDLLKDFRQLRAGFNDARREETVPNVLPAAHDIYN